LLQKYGAYHLQNISKTALHSCICIYSLIRVAYTCIIMFDITYHNCWRILSTMATLWRCAEWGGILNRRSCIVNEKIVLECRC
jgi:hypothetical protein